MPPRVKPYTQADLIPPAPRQRRAHVGRILTPPVPASTGEYFYRVEILAGGSAEPRVLPRVRELVSPVARAAAGRLGPGDYVLVQQLSRAVWIIAGLAPNPVEWKNAEPAAGLQVGGSGLVVTPDGFVLDDGAAHLRAQEDLLEMNAPRGRIIAPDFAINAASGRVSKADGAPLSLWADEILLRSADPWPGGASYRQIDLLLDDNGLRLSADATANRPTSGRMFLAVVDADNWATASARFARNASLSGRTWGDVLDLFTGAIRPVTVSLVDSDFTSGLAHGSAPGASQPDAQSGAAIVQLAQPADLALTTGPRYEFTWGAVANAGSFRMELAVFDGARVHMATHPVIESLPMPTFAFDQADRPPLLGVEKAVFDAETRAGSPVNRVIDDADVTPVLTSGAAFMTSVASELVRQSVVDRAGRSRLARSDDYARVLGFCWRVMAEPADIKTHSGSEFSDWHTTLHLQLLDGLEFG